MYHLFDSALGFGSKKQQNEEASLTYVNIHEFIVSFQRVKIYIHYCVSSLLHSNWIHDIDVFCFFKWNRASDSQHIPFNFHAVVFDCTKTF